MAGDNLTNGLTDIHGNRVALSGSSYTDPLGQALIVSGSGTPSSPVTYQYPGAGGVMATVTENFEAINVTQSAGAGCFGPWSGILNVPATLVYPDGETYRFAYNGAGQLNQLTLPTGGVITYGGAVNIQCSGVAGQITRTESYDPDHYWTWTLNAGTDQETDPYFNGTQFVFSNGALTEVDTNPAHGSTLTRTTIATSINGGVTTKTATTELFGTGSNPPAPKYAVHTDSFQGPLTTASSDTDWGPTTAGGPSLRSVAITYIGSGNATVPSAVTTSGPGGGAASDKWLHYDGAANLTDEEDFYTTINYLTRSFTHNPNGTLATATDANGAVTNYIYGGAGCGLFPTEIRGPIPAALDTTLTWDCAGGVLKTSTDVNGATTATTYADPSHMWRPSSTSAPDGAITNFAYSANSVESSMLFNGNSSVTDLLTTLDLLGRPILRQQRQGPGAGTFDSVETFYDAMDRATGTSQPFAAAAGAATGTQATTVSFDLFSRPLKVTDGGGGEMDYAYQQNDTAQTVVGTPSVVKQSEFDALGRLSSVCEGSASTAGICAQTAGLQGYWTKYTRNGLGTITQVEQNALSSTPQFRTFAFDLLGRMTYESNPESGATSYYYDGDSTCGNSVGDLVKRTDANGNTTCYGYDAMHRVSLISYPSGPNAAASPSKNYFYDSAPGYPQTNTGGRLAEAITGPGGSPLTQEVFAYDSVGRETGAYQRNPQSGAWYSALATYYPNGATASLSLPGAALPIIYYGIDGEGRPTTVNGGSSALVSAATYSTLGLTSVTLGSNDFDTYRYDPQTGRMTSFQASVNGQTNTGTLTWNANGTLGSLATNNNIPGGPASDTCTYAHDDMARIAGVTCGAWSQTFAFDAYGNVSKSGTQSFGATYSASTNRISTNINFAPQYDPNGNLLDDPVSASRNVNQFDAEGKPVVLEGQAVTFDAMGRAVAAAVSGGIQFVYAPNGAKMEVMSGSTLLRADIPLPGGGEAVYNAGGLAYYRHPDHLGSSRVASTPAQALNSATSYAPYGEPYAQAGATDLSFTGQKQDVAGGQYDFLMREYNPIQGRWWTPDPAGQASVDPSNPQTWNRYAYANSKPLEMIDPQGLWPFYTHEAIYALGFGSQLSRADLDIVDRASWNMDFAAGQQSPNFAFEHAMSDGLTGQTAFQSLLQEVNFINAQLGYAFDAQQQWQDDGNSGYSPDALVHFGNAVHTITDSTSPAHENNQPWSDSRWGAIKHVLHEALPNPFGDNFGDGVDHARQAFNETFPGGFDPGMDIERPRVGWYCVGVAGDPNQSCGWYFVH